MNDQTSTQLQMIVYASLMATLTAAGAWISIPIGQVPIVLQNFFILLSGLMLGSRWGLAGVAIYLLAGMIGLPVFAGGTGGIGKFAGPTGGYLMGFLPAVYVIGLISEKAGRRIAFDIMAVICGSLIIYACGVPWLKMITGMPWGKAFALGMYPFLIGDTLKIVAVVPVALTLRPMIKSPDRLMNG